MEQLALYRAISTGVCSVNGDRTLYRGLFTVALLSSMTAVGVASPKAEGN